MYVQLSIGDYMTDVHITKHSGKMLGIPSINTNPLTNQFCQRMHGCGNDKIICTHCYAVDLASFRQSMTRRIEQNSDVLSNEVLSMWDLPKYDDELLRFHSFGELINLTHVVNILNICYNNPMTQHVIYTKRLHMLRDMQHLKPNNLKIIESNPLINNVLDNPTDPIADAIFNVVTKDYLEQHPSCKATCKMACNSCRLCYSRNTVRSIVELLK